MTRQRTVRNQEKSILMRKGSEGLWQERKCSFTNISKIQCQSLKVCNTCTCTRAHITNGFHRMGAIITATNAFGSGDGITENKTV